MPAGPDVGVTVSGSSGGPPVTSNTARPYDVKVEPLHAPSTKYEPAGELADRVRPAEPTDPPAGIVTKAEPFKGFYPAESYHQNYLTLHPTQMYIAINDIPKVQNLGKLFPAIYSEKPTLVKG